MDNFSFDDLIFKDKNGNTVENNEQYIKSLQKNSSFEEKLEVGDIVKLKGDDSSYEVMYIDYEIPGIGIVDYAAKNISRDEADLTLFNQKDILEKVDKHKQNGR